MRTQYTIVINRSTDLVFGIVSNLENMANYEGMAMSGRKASARGAPSYLPHLRNTSLPPKRPVWSTADSAANHESSRKWGRKKKGGRSRARGGSWFRQALA
jgi:hypothetical protein